MANQNQNNSRQDAILKHAAFQQTRLGIIFIGEARSRTDPPLELLSQLAFAIEDSWLTSLAAQGYGEDEYGLAMINALTTILLIDRQFGAEDDITYETLLKMGFDESSRYRDQFEADETLAQWIDDYLVAATVIEPLKTATNYADLLRDLKAHIVSRDLSTYEQGKELFSMNALLFGAHTPVFNDPNEGGSDAPTLLSMEGVDIILQEQREILIEQFFALLLNADNEDEAIDLAAFKYSFDAIERNWDLYFELQEDIHVRDHFGGNLVSIGNTIASLFDRAIDLEVEGDLGGILLMLGNYQHMGSMNYATEELVNDMLKDLRKAQKGQFESYAELLPWIQIQVEEHGLDRALMFNEDELMISQDPNDLDDQEEGFSLDLTKLDFSESGREKIYTYWAALKKLSKSHKTVSLEDYMDSTLHSISHRLESALSDWNYPFPIHTMAEGAAVPLIIDQEDLVIEASNFVFYNIANFDLTPQGINKLENFWNSSESAAAVNKFGTLELFLSAVKIKILSIVYINLGLDAIRPVTLTLSPEIVLEDGDWIFKSSNPTK